MSETDSKTVRPTKKQRDILTYIEQFIGEHGYSPSYREIMNGLDYTSVATVALHVGNLIRRGHLRKRDRSARSLEVVNPTEWQPSKRSEAKPTTAQPAGEAWFITAVEHKFQQSEKSGTASDADRADLTALVDALRVLGLEAAYQEYSQRLRKLAGQTAAVAAETVKDAVAKAEVT